MAVVLVDAENVRRSVWPNIGERRLADLVCAWAHEHDRATVLVFDGATPDGVVGVAERDQRCVLVGSGAETADDWIVRRAGELEAAGEPFWLITSDRALRAVAGRAAEKTIGGGSFARELRGG